MLGEMAEGRRRRALAPVAVVLLASCGAGAADAASAPQGRAALANRCVTAAVGKRFAERLYLKPTRLGAYMLHDRARRLVAAGEGDAVVRAAEPGVAAEWEARRAGGGRFRLRSASNARLLAAASTGRGLVTVPAAVRGPRTAFRFTRARGCRRYPEAALGARGTVFRGALKSGDVFGYADAHLHVTADLRAGGAR
jgi:hypothetical protein